MNRVAVLSGATGFLGGEVFRNIQSWGLFDEVVLVGMPRHLDALRRFRSSPNGLVVSVVELSRLKSELEIKSRNSSFTLLMFANSFVRGLSFAGFGDYFRDRIFETQALVEPLARYRPFVLYPLSWHSWRQIQTPYSISKNAIEQLLLGFEALGAISLARVVLFDTYGPGDSRDKLVPKLLKIDNTDVKEFLSDPLAMINLTHSDDIVRGVRRVIESGESGLYQLRNCTDSYVWEVAKHLGKWTGPSPVEMDFLPDRLPAIPARAPDGWEATTSLEEGLSRLVGSWSEQRW